MFSAGWINKRTNTERKVEPHTHTLTFALAKASFSSLAALILRVISAFLRESEVGSVCVCSVCSRHWDEHYGDSFLLICTLRLPWIYQQATRERHLWWGHSHSHWQAALSLLMANHQKKTGAWSFFDSLDSLSRSCCSSLLVDRFLAIKAICNGHWQQQQQQRRRRWRLRSIRQGSSKKKRISVQREKEWEGRRKGDSEKKGTQKGQQFNVHWQIDSVLFLFFHFA